MENELEQIKRFAHRAVSLLPSQDRRQQLVEARTLCILIEEAARAALAARGLEVRKIGEGE